MTHKASTIIHEANPNLDSQGQEQQQPEEKPPTVTSVTHGRSSRARLLRGSERRCAVTAADSSDVSYFGAKLFASRRLNEKLQRSDLKNSSSRNCVGETGGGGVGWVKESKHSSIAWVAG